MLKFRRTPGAAGGRPSPPRPLVALELQLLERLHAHAARRGREGLGALVRVAHGRRTRHCGHPAGRSAELDSKLRLVYGDGVLPLRSRLAKPEPRALTPQARPRPLCDRAHHYYPLRRAWSALSSVCCWWRAVERGGGGGGVEGSPQGVCAAACGCECRRRASAVARARARQRLHRVRLSLERYAADAYGLPTTSPFYAQRSRSGRTLCGCDVCGSSSGGGFS